MGLFAKRSTASTITIRPLTRGDGFAMAVLDRNGYSACGLAWHPGDWSRILGGRMVATGAFRNDLLVGFVLTESLEDTIHVVKLAIHPRYRRLGIGTMLAQRPMSRVADPDSVRRTVVTCIPTRRSYLPAACFLRSLGWRGEETDAGRSYRFWWAADMATGVQNCPAMVP